MKQKWRNELILEICLIIVIVGLSCLTFQLNNYQMVVLNLFFLPVLLGAFFLGRYRAGVLALLSFVLVTIVAAQDFRQFTAVSSPVTTALAITIWGAVLGLTTIIAGTLSEERTTQITELQASYIGVIEVLSKYLHGMNAQQQSRPPRIAELSLQIGSRMRLSAKELDEVRVAALLQEMDHIEVTARVVRKAMANFDADHRTTAECKFNGADLVQSLGAVISGALPLLCRCEDALTRAEQDVGAEGPNSPLGAQIIRTARTYDGLVYGQNASMSSDPATALAELQAGTHGAHNPVVLKALREIVLSQDTGDVRRGPTAAVSGPSTLPAPHMTASA